MTASVTRRHRALNNKHQRAWSVGLLGTQGANFHFSKQHASVTHAAKQRSTGKPGTSGEGEGSDQERCALRRGLAPPTSGADPPGPIRPPQLSGVLGDHALKNVGSPCGTARLSVTLHEEWGCHPAEVTAGSGPARGTIPVEEQTMQDASPAATLWLPRTTAGYSERLLPVLLQKGATLNPTTLASVTPCPKLTVPPTLSRVSCA